MRPAAPSFPRGGGAARAAAAILALLAAPLPAGGPLWAAETGRVSEVVDGDTVRVAAGHGPPLTVRLVGIDAPEKGHPAKGREFLAEESARALAALCDGKPVRLEADAEDRDKYGRLLRYIHVSSPDGGRELLVNLEMIRRGWARVARRFAFARRPEFLDAENEARRAGAGIWSGNGLGELRWLRSSGAHPVEVWPAAGGRYIVASGGLAKADVGPGELPGTVAEIARLEAESAGEDLAGAAREAGFADVGTPGESRSPGAGAGPADNAVVPWEDAARHVGETVTVEGTIVRTRMGRKALFLNFHPNWKRYLTVVILGADLRRFPPDGERYYRDRVVRVTGEVVLYDGRPEIVVRSPDALSVLR